MAVAANTTHHPKKTRGRRFNGESGLENSDRFMRASSDGGAEGARTPDLGIANAALSQLSYSPTYKDVTHLRRLMRHDDRQSEADFTIR